MTANIRRLWLIQIQRAVFQMLSIMLLSKAAVCQNWLKKRHDLRQRCRINAAIQYKEDVSNAVIKDISPHGARLESQQAFHTGDRIGLRFSLHYLEAPVELWGTVVWAKGNSSGLQFDLS